MFGSSLDPLFAVMQTRAFSMAGKHGEDLLRFLDRSWKMWEDLSVGTVGRPDLAGYECF